MEYINTKKAPAAVGAYSQAVKVGNMLYVSGQIALDANGKSFIGSGIEEETHQVMKNIKAILTSADGGLKNIVKSSIFLKDLSQFSKVNEVYASYLNNDFLPARETVQVSELPLDASIEISIIASI